MKEERNRPRIPYGYCLVNGTLRIEPEENRKLLLLFENYVRGYSLKDCLKLSGVERSIGWLRSVFDNETYMGKNDYPQLVPEKLWKKANAEAKRRGAKTIGREKLKLRQKPVPVETAFFYARPVMGNISEDPVEAAAQMYRHIRIRGKREPSDG